ncbi:trypsin alpha-3 [Episyrphus balteatus]|uniref:trypsin alpha-3 n=1 Tax=Episyrphus balteatus TaxID=286459 RepID=UPI0024869E46|nr:trypsin alpha-3 [Episyrphus balteatus]
MIFHKNLKAQNLVVGIFVFFHLVKSVSPKPPKLNLTYFVSGGTPYDSHDLGKFVVSIQLRSYHQDSKLGWYHFCGGTIISSKKILTAAHCLYKHSGVLYMPYEIVVVVGLRHRFTRSDGTRIKDVALIKRHKSFRRGSTLFADVGFLILKDEIVFNNPRVGVIKLTNSRPRINELCTVVGWGKLFDKGPTSDKILFVDVEILSRRDCKRKYGSSFTLGMICAGYPENWERDSCSGDSGGPMICDNVLVGIVSWGVGCGRRHLPGVYTDVYSFRKWISKGMRLKPNYFVLVLSLSALKGSFIYI